MTSIVGGSELDFNDRYFLKDVTSQRRFLFRLWGVTVSYPRHIIHLF